MFQKGVEPDEGGSSKMWDIVDDIRGIEKALEEGQNQNPQIMKSDSIPSFESAHNVSFFLIINFYMIDM